MVFLLATTTAESDAWPDLPFLSLLLRVLKCAKTQSAGRSLPPTHCPDKLASSPCQQQNLTWPRRGHDFAKAHETSSHQSSRVESLCCRGASPLCCPNRSGPISSPVSCDMIPPPGTDSLSGGLCSYLIVCLPIDKGGNRSLGLGDDAQGGRAPNLG